MTRHSYSPLDFKPPPEDPVLAANMVKEIKRQISINKSAKGIRIGAAHPSPTSFVAAPSNNHANYRDNHYDNDYARGRGYENDHYDDRIRDRNGDYIRDRNGNYIREKYDDRVRNRDGDFIRDRNGDFVRTGNNNKGRNSDYGRGNIDQYNDRVRNRDGDYIRDRNGDFVRTGNNINRDRYDDRTRFSNGDYVPRQYDDRSVDSRGGPSVSQITGRLEKNIRNQFGDIVDRVNKPTKEGIVDIPYTPDKEIVDKIDGHLRKHVVPEVKVRINFNEPSKKVTDPSELSFSERRSKYNVY